MCKDLDKIFGNEKNPKEAIFILDQKKWVMPSEMSQFEMQVNSPPFASFDHRKSTDLELNNELLSPRESKNNPIKSLGSKVKGIFKWFQKEKPIKVDDESQGSHRSADIEETI